MEIVVRLSLFFGLLCMQTPLIVGLVGPEYIIYHLGTALVTAALLLGSWCNLSPISAALTRRVSATCLVVFTLGWTAYIIARYYAGDYAVYDTGIYAQLINTIGRGGGFWSGVHAKNALSNHFTPVAIVLPPLFAITSTLLWLPLLKVLAWFCSALLLHIFCKELFGRHSIFIWIFPLLWIMHRFGAALLRAEFQFSTLTLPLILAVFILLRREKIGSAALLTIVMCLFRENLTLIAVCAGVYLICFLKRPKTGGLFILSGIVLGALLYFVVMPELGVDRSLSHSERFAPLSLWPDKLTLLFFSLLSVGFLPVFSPRSLLVLFPAYAVSLLSGDLQMISHDFHYHDIALPVLFICMAHGVHSLLKLNQKYRLPEKSARIATALLAALLIRYHNHYPMQPLRSQIDNQKTQILTEIDMISSIVPDSAALFVPNTPGAYFFQFPYMQLDRPDKDHWCQPESYIVTTLRGNPWPYTPTQYTERAKKLRQLVENGLALELFTGEDLALYKTLHVQACAQA